MKKNKKNKTATPSKPINPFIGLPSAGLGRRLGALIYDALVVIAVMLFSAALGAVVAILLEKMGLISTAGHVDMAAYLSHNIFYQLWIWFVFISFYVFFWTRGGQTIGMRAWRLRVQNEDGSPINKSQAVIRLATATCGLGNLFVPFNKPKHRSFQDHWAECEVVVLTKELNERVTIKGVKWY
ncbi:RDD family protein [Motilimonas cestriensis]|uniref:RDD family protein n=1 Tax=Motilimonas cestriensis TaxID=2742685 RepID=A0ABS8WD84_9GAMM|nr:RDD family protein [Motilimonas cestriensis]MCE2596282.1 RDD family protein [Motilimonas cestriensis]